MSNKPTTLPTVNPQRGEIWWVDFDPTTGEEIRKTRPAVVLTAPGMGRYKLKVVVPIIEWKSHYNKFIWMLKLTPLQANGLIKDSSADASQVKSVSTDRFKNKLGQVTADELEEIVAAVALVIGYSP